MSVNAQGIGTTKFFFIPKGAPHNFAHGEFYLFGKVSLARVILTGGWWKNVTSLALSSATSISGGTAPAVSAKSINQAVRVNSGIRNRQISCGKNIVDVVPATMETLGVQFKMTASRRDPVDEFFKLIEGEQFASALSFAPAVLEIGKTLGAVVPGLLKVFTGDSPQEEPGLDGSLDFNLIGERIQPGYYAVLASMGENTELPKLQRDDQLSVLGNDLLLDGKPIVQASYVVFEIGVAQFRGIAATSAQWVTLYERTVQALQDVIDDVTPPSEWQNVLDNSLKAIYAVSEMQSEDFTYTKLEKSVYRGKLTEQFKKAKAHAAAAPPSNAVVHLEAALPPMEESLNGWLTNYDTALEGSLQAIAAFEAPIS